MEYLNKMFKLKALYLMLITSLISFLKYFLQI